MANKFEVYRRLKDFQDMERIPYAQLSEELGLSEKSLAGHVGQARRNDRMYLLLVQKGIPPEEIPEWFERSEGHL